MSVGSTFEELFRAEFGRLVRALALAFGTAVAEDAVADAFIEAERRWPTIGAYDDPVAWVRRVATNRAIDARRRTSRWVPLPAVEPGAGGDHPLTDELVDLQAAVAALPPRTRAMFSLYYLADLSIAEVAAALDVSAGHVKSTLRDARTQVRSTTRQESP
ncbi:MAG: sigma-70 family RNA polymerase sigma factor [Acidimicrobiales bacterium]|nr:sigma-70 family RNA polymerase sigma factor [Acidimicrobiales bacterium]